MKLSSTREYLEAYEKSIQDPTGFWEGVARNFHWEKEWDTVMKADFEKAEFSWFEGAHLNITINCIDRHLESQADERAILWVPNNPDEEALEISYQMLHDKVCQLANVLKSQGVKKGDRVCIYLPMIPELAYAVLACARIGAIHSVVFAGFSSEALGARIQDCEASVLITSDVSLRGHKIIDLKTIVDRALETSDSIRSVLVARRGEASCPMQEGRDHWLAERMEQAETSCTPEIMESEDPIFILYTSGSTGQPKGMVHSTAGYMVYTAYSFQNVFQYEPGDLYWCTADIGWITGHSYIIYGPFCVGAQTLMFEGIPSYPDYGRFWEIVERYQVNQFYTAPTAIRALAKCDLNFVQNKKLDSLKVIGTVGEPINEEAWHWYDDHVGRNSCPVVDTWWQTETGGIMLTSLPGISPSIPTCAGPPLPGIRPVLLDHDGLELNKPAQEAALCIAQAWPSMARTIWGNHQRYIDTYFKAYPGYYFSGDSAFRNPDGYYRVVGRMDDIIIVSGHNLGTAPIENAINEHPAVVESAIVGFPHDIKGNALYGFVTLSYMDETRDTEAISSQINELISNKIGPIAKLDKIQYTMGLPKTRSGKIMRRILRKIAAGESKDFGDISTLLNPEVVERIVEGYKK